MRQTEHDIIDARAIPKPLQRLFSNPAGWLSFQQNDIISVDTAITTTHLSPNGRAPAMGDIEQNSMVDRTYTEHANLLTGFGLTPNFVKKIVSAGWRNLIITETKAAKMLPPVTHYREGANMGAHTAWVLGVVMMLYNVKSKRYSFDPHLDSVQETTGLFLRLVSRATLGNTRSEYSSFKEMIHIAAIIYKNLVVNLSRQRCMFTTRVEYITQNQEPGAATFSSLVKLKANTNIVATEVLFLAMRLAKLLADKLRYDINAEGHSTVTKISFSINAGAAFGTMSHSVRGSMGADEFFNLTNHLDDPAHVASFEALKRKLSSWGKVLMSPKSIKNCVLAALYMSRDQHPYPTEARELRRFITKLSQAKAAFQIPDDTQNDVLLEIVDQFASNRLHERNTIVVLNMFGDAVHVANGGATTEASRSASAKEHVRILIFAGHAFALVDKRKAVQMIGKTRVYRPRQTVEQRIERETARHVGTQLTPKLPYSVYDIETLGESARAYMLGFRYSLDHNPRVRIATGLDDCVEAFFEWIYYNIEDYHVFYAHNGGKFDIAVMMKYIFGPQEKFKLIDMLVHNGRTITLKVLFIKSRNVRAASKKVVVEFRDSYPMLPGSQRALAKSFGIGITQKGEMNHDIITEENYMTQIDKQSIHEYLRRDVQGLYDIMQAFDSSFEAAVGFGPWRNGLTVSGLARLKFLAYYYNMSVTPIREQTKEEDEQTRKALHGGISACDHVCEYPPHENHENVLTYGDIKSLYPYMMKNVLPYEAIGWEPVTEESFGGFFGFLNVEVRGGREDKFNSIYINHETAGLIAPKFENWHSVYIFSEELRHAYDNREFYQYEFRFSDGLRYKSAFVLRKIATDLFKLKNAQKKGTVLYEVYKLLLNSLYGFSISKREGIGVSVTENARELLKYFWTGDLQEVRAHKKFYMYKSNKFIDISFRYAPLGTAITGYARAYMNSIRMKIAKAGGETFQIDTDGLVTNLSVPELIAAGVDWGFHWGGLCHDLAKKPEDVVVITNGVFIAPKIYALKGTINGQPFEVAKCKGFPKRMWHKRTVTGDDVVYSDSSPGGTMQLGYDDIRWLLHGRIGCEVLRFVGGVRMWMMEVPTLKKETAVVMTSGIINKGTVGENGYVHNLVI